MKLKRRGMLQALFGAGVAGSAAAKSAETAVHASKPQPRAKKMGPCRHEVELRRIKAGIRYLDGAGEVSYTSTCVPTSLPFPDYKGMYGFEKE